MFHLNQCMKNSKYSMIAVILLQVNFYKGSPLEVFCRKYVHAKLTGKYLCRYIFLIKSQASRPMFPCYNLLKYK